MGDFGGKLRQARERRGISLRQIAAATKISVGVLEALERNDVSKLPGGIFSRAFVRSYATEVGLDPDDTVREFLAEFPGESTTTAHAAGHVAPHHAPSHHVVHGAGEIAAAPLDESQFESQQRTARVVLRLLFVGIPIALLIVYLSMRGGAPRPAPGIEAAPPSMPPPTPAPPPAAIPDARPAKSEPKPLASAPRPAAPLPPTEQAAPDAEPLTIELRPTAECWISIAVDGAPSFSRLMQAGEREVRAFRDEVVLTVGNGAACEFLLNDRPARLLGKEGEARKVRITRRNVTDYLQ